MNLYYLKPKDLLYGYLGFKGNPVSKKKALGMVADDGRGSRCRAAVLYRDYIGVT